MLKRAERNAKPDKLAKVKAIKPPFVFGQKPIRIIKDGEPLAVCDKCGKIVLIATADAYSNEMYGCWRRQSPNHNGPPGNPKPYGCNCAQSPMESGIKLGRHLRDLVDQRIPSYEYRNAPH